MEVTPSIFESIRGNIRRSSEDPTAVGKAEKELCRLETKFAKCAKSMAKVLQVHSQMKSEIDKLKETVALQEHDLTLARNDSEKSKKLIAKLKREKRQRKKQMQNYKLVQKPPSPLLDKKVTSIDMGSDYSTPMNEFQDVTRHGIEERDSKDNQEHNYFQEKEEKDDSSDVSLQTKSNIEFKSNTNDYNSVIPKNSKSVTFKIDLFTGLINNTLDISKNEKFLITQQLEDAKSTIQNKNTVQLKTSPEKCDSTHNKQSLDMSQELYENTSNETMTFPSNEDPYLQVHRPSIVEDTPDIIMDTKVNDHPKRNEMDDRSDSYTSQIGNLTQKQSKMSEHSPQSSETSSAEFITISEWNEVEENCIRSTRSNKRSSVSSDRWNKELNKPVDRNIQKENDDQSKLSDTVYTDKNKEMEVSSAENITATENPLQNDNDELKLKLRKDSTSEDQEHTPIGRGKQEIDILI